MNESYEKRLNILIHCIQESPVNAWERPDETLAHVYDFMKAGLQIKDPTKIVLADCHRLPQSRGVFRGGAIGPWPPTFGSLGLQNCIVK